MPAGANGLRLSFLTYSEITSLHGYVEDENGRFDWAAPNEGVFALINDLERPVGQVVLRVRDRGSGLLAGSHERLFQRFCRLDGGRTRSGRVGTGLGLYVSRQLARAMHGDVVLEASGPDGSVFKPWLPAA